MPMMLLLFPSISIITIVISDTISFLIIRKFPVTLIGIKAGVRMYLGYQFCCIISIILTFVTFLYAYKTFFYAFTKQSNTLFSKIITNYFFLSFFLPLDSIKMFYCPLLSIFKFANNGK